MKSHYLSIVFRLGNPLIVIISADQSVRLTFILGIALKNLILLSINLVAFFIKYKIQPVQFSIPI